MTNAQMTPNRFSKWAEYRKRLSAIKNHLIAGGKVAVTTCLKCTVYTSKHADMFKATRSGLFVQRGKGWDCLNFTSVSFI